MKMEAKKHITEKEAREIGAKLGIKWDKFDVGQFRRGMEVELKHGLQDPGNKCDERQPFGHGQNSPSTPQ
jgi:hypothetical protein